MDYKEPPSFRNHFSQKKVYLVNTSIFDLYGFMRSLRHLETISVKKMVYLNTSISDDFGLRNTPVIHKPFSPKKGIPYKHLYFLRNAVKEPRHSEKNKIAKERYTSIV